MCANVTASWHTLVLWCLCNLTETPANPHAQTHTYRSHTRLIKLSTYADSDTQRRTVPPQPSVVPGHFNGKLKASLMSVVCRTGMRAATEDKSGSVPWQDTAVSSYPWMCAYACTCVCVRSCKGLKCCRRCKSVLSAQFLSWIQNAVVKALEAFYSNRVSISCLSVFKWQ